MASPRPDDGDSVDRGTLSEAQDIYSQAVNCKALFVRYLEMSSAYSQQVSACHSRFLTWASFLGVFTSKNASLDRRLEFSPDIKGLVMSMLKVLQKKT